MIVNDRAHAPPSSIFPVTGAMVAIIVFHVLALLASGRDWTGGCVGPWQADMRPECNSMHPADPYSIMHIGFGLAISVLFKALRPKWRTKDILLLVVFSSTVWEVVENLPLVIEMFSYDDRPQLAYDGDSIVNSLGDTVATVLGGALALVIPRWAALVAVLLIDLIMSVWIGDGYTLGFMRLFAG